MSGKEIRLLCKYTLDGESVHVLNIVVRPEHPRIAHSLNAFSMLNLLKSRALSSCFIFKGNYHRTQHLLLFLFILLRYRTHFAMQLAT